MVGCGGGRSIPNWFGWVLGFSFGVLPLRVQIMILICLWTSWPPYPFTTQSRCQHRPARFCER